MVILQPQFFPWGGAFEQIRLADIYVHYDDVQFPQGRSFTNRVQAKTANGIAWMTVPVLHDGLQPINAMKIDYTQRWQKKHLTLLQQSYSKSPFAADMMKLAEAALSREHNNLADLNIQGIESVAAYFGFKPQFFRSSALHIKGSATERLVNICRHFGADTYISGLGAKKYVDYDLFEKAGIRFEYMDYQRNRYPQSHGEFTPHVTILDLVANAGPGGGGVLASGSKYWKDVIAADSSAAPGTGIDH